MTFIKIIALVGLKGMSTSRYFGKTESGVAAVSQSIRRRHVVVKYEEPPSEEKPKPQKRGRKDMSILATVATEANDEKETMKTEVQLKWEPKNWRQLLDNIKEMRRDKTAVVDLQGCERTADIKEKPEVPVLQTILKFSLTLKFA